MTNALQIRALRIFFVYWNSAKQWWIMQPNVFVVASEDHCTPVCRDAQYLPGNWFSFSLRFEHDFEQLVERHVGFDVRPLFRPRWCDRNLRSYELGYLDAVDSGRMRIVGRVESYSAQD